MRAVRFWAVLVLTAGLCAAVPALAQFPASGTRNFTPPGGVPNYFSNEAGAPLGSGGIVHARPAPSAVAAAPSARVRVASAAHHHGSRHAAAKRGRHATRLAAARAKRRAVAAAAHRRTRTAARTSASRHAAAHARDKTEPVKDAARGHAAPAKEKHPAHRAG
jgi:hypothetical protein